MPAIVLRDRALIRLSGRDAAHFLNNLVTADLAGLVPGEARPAALLTPQGKILFDFLVWRNGEDFLIEVTAGEVEALVRRLTLYKLRADVTITPEQSDGITVVWNEKAAEGAVQDARFAAAGMTLYRLAGAHGDEDTSPYTALRIAHGIAEAGRDYPLQDAFPHDALLDLNGGVSFRKGCYVGQEVVSRMHHRKTARRRVVVVTGETDLPETGTVLTAKNRPLGALGSVAGKQGLAILRIDRAGEAMASGQAVLAGDVAVTLALPDWSGLSFPLAAEEE
ncbi:CAF17-like 4Fe-4S cluster assembly/insertion protein YgfZ [Allorhizobium undicola]|uniref:CAF17-like 4Fe-4S cluster assembly/insertion protein YgfZ n=1 Tax=Allorhizobium undicola TaxID=78527 RepID=UPI0004873257|nr:folate-binding protein YgfZ [Allorhizobium undicola]